MAKMEPFYVDLRSYSPDEIDRISERIDMMAYTISFVAGMPGVYYVMWDHAISISEAFGLPADLVTRYQPRN